MSSSTTPSATPATMTVATFSEMLNQPMAPRTATTGNTFGTSASSPKRTERKTTNMAAKIDTNAVLKLEICDLTR